jgi:hypothetical protein
LSECFACVASPSSHWAGEEPFPWRTWCTPQEPVDYESCFFSLSVCSLHIFPCNIQQEAWRPWSGEQPTGGLVVVMWPQKRLTTVAVTVLWKHRIYYVRRDVNYELDRSDWDSPTVCLAFSWLDDWSWPSPARLAAPWPVGAVVARRRGHHRCVPVATARHCAASASLAGSRATSVCPTCSVMQCKSISKNS